LLKGSHDGVDVPDMQGLDRRRTELTAAIVASSVVLAFFLWLAFHVGGHSGVVDFDDTVTALAALSAAVACLFAGLRQQGAGRRFWMLMALALGAWTCAEVIWGVYDLVLHEAVPVPSWADVGYLSAIPLAAGALLSHPGLRAGGRHRGRAMLDGLAIGLAVLLVSWTFVLGPLWRHTDLTTAGGIVALAYPFGDVLIMFLIILSIRSMESAGRRALLWVLVGLAAMAVSDSIYAYLVEVGRYSTGNFVDIGWVVGYLAIAVGASGAAGVVVRAPSDASGEASLLSLVTPYVPVLLALSVVTVELELHHRMDRFSWLTSFGLALLVIARQALALLDRSRQQASWPPELEDDPWDSDAAPSLGHEPGLEPSPASVGRPS
jgi:diguanylate cyclase